MLKTPTPAPRSNGYYYRQPARPRSVTFLALGVLTLAGLNAARAVGAVRALDFLAQVQVVSPLYQVISGSIWAAAGLVLVWGLWRGRPWTPRAALAFTAAYITYFWIDTMAFAASLEHFNAWPFAAVMSMLLLGLVFWIVTRPRAWAYFYRKTGRTV